MFEFNYNSEIKFPGNTACSAIVVSLLWAYVNLIKITMMLYPSALFDIWAGAVGHFN